MRAQTERSDVDEAHRAASRVKLERLQQQRQRPGRLPRRAAGRRRRRPRLLQGLPPVQDVQRPALQPGARQRTPGNLSGVRLLIVKTSSMGDVVHAAPVVADIRRAPSRRRRSTGWWKRPLPPSRSCTPACAACWPMAWRKWRGQLFSGATWRRDARAARASCGEQRYDLVLDLQGLRQERAVGAPGRRAGGRLRPRQHPRAAGGLGLPAHGGGAARPARRAALPASGRRAPGLRGAGQPRPTSACAPRAGGWAPRGAYAVLIPNASRRREALARAALGGRRPPPAASWAGRRVVLWGRPDEQTLAERIAAGCDGDVPPFLKVGEMAAVLAGAQHVVGLDTGFTHLAAALGRPTLGIYCDHEPGPGRHHRARPGGQHRRQGAGAVARRRDGPAGSPARRPEPHA